jgi:hypothetical protein
MKRRFVISLQSRPARTPSARSRRLQALDDTRFVLPPVRRGRAADFFGREGGRFSMEEMTELKWIIIESGQRAFPM